MQLIEDLQWRYATKEFDPMKKVTEEDLDKLKQVIRLSASSYGLQPYKVLIIEDQELKRKLKPLSWGQAKVVDASHLIVFCNYLQTEEQHIEEYMERMAYTREQSIEEVAGYGNFIKEKMSKKTQPEMNQWAANQAYIALGNLLVACANMKIDACPMEGFEKDEYDEVLGLKEKGLTTTVMAAIGYRAEEDLSQYHKKVRKPMEGLFEMR